MAFRDDVYRIVKKIPRGVVVECAGFNPEEERAKNLRSLGRTAVVDSSY